MSNWTQIHEKLIQHECGFQILLNVGSWRSPLDVDPRNTKHLSPIEAANLLADGLMFARQQARPFALREKHRNRSPAMLMR